MRGKKVIVHSVSQCLCMTQQTFVYQPFDFPPLYELPSSPLTFQATTGKILFCFQPKMIFKVSAVVILVSYSVFLGFSYVCVLSR